MLSISYSAGLFGIDGYLVTVEASITNRLPAFEIVGLPDMAVREAKERIKTAFESSGVEFPDGAVMINMAPADKKKEGSAFDLALSAAILHASGRIPREVSLEKCCFIGELSLSGGIRCVQGVLCMCAAAKSVGKTEVFVPKANAGEAAVVDGINVYGVGSIAEMINHFNGRSPIERTVFDKERYMRESSGARLDFADVKGQEGVKRALEIAAAGGHNIFMIGPPGTGKSMLAKRLPTILPEMTFDEAIETTKIHSVSGLLNGGKALFTERPFRSPHHTMSAISLSGGGRIPIPGEISLAHNGVLFLDEFLEFGKSATEVLRQPLEDRVITITRASGRVTFPCSFMLVCAANPCRCGYIGHPTNKCTCKPDDVRAYRSKISGPLTDRIDIQIEVPSLSFDDLSRGKGGESSADIRARVNSARQVALDRIKSDPNLRGQRIHCNAELSSREIKKYCLPDADALILLKSAFERMGMSARGYDRILRVARTIADMEFSESIKAVHIAEAIQLRALDRKI